MDEDEIEQDEHIPSIKHDGWSVLILGLSWAAKIAETTMLTLDKGVSMACEHANYKVDNNEFKELARRWGDG